MTDDVKDQNVKIVLAGGEPLEYLVRTGEILDAQRQAFSQTHVSGGGSTTSVSSYTTHWAEDTIFYKCGDAEHSVEFRNNTVPIRPGNCVSFIFVGRPGDDSHYLTGIYNHSTRRGESLHRREPIEAPGLISLLLVTGVAFGLPFLFIKSLIASTLVGVISAIIAGSIANAVRKSLFKGRLQGEIGLIIESLRSGRDLLELHQEPARHATASVYAPLRVLVIMIVVVIALFGMILVSGYLWNKYNAWEKHKDVPMYGNNQNALEIANAHRESKQPQSQLKPQPQPQLKPQTQPKPQPIQQGLQVGQGKVSWSANAKSFRGKNGQRFTYACPVGGRASGAVWGTDLYTDDSAVCVAAVHAGLITQGNGGTVDIEIRPGANAYKGSLRNGINSKNYGRWKGSFSFVTGP